MSIILPAAVAAQVPFAKKALELAQRAPKASTPPSAKRSTKPGKPPAARRVRRSASGDGGSNDDDPARHHIDRRAREIIDQLAIDLADDFLLTTLQCANWLGVSTQFLELGRIKGYGPPAVDIAPRVVRYRKNSVLQWLLERERAYAERMKAGA